jgi:LAS superfamily LD-carboxypeptidase LdcB
MRLIPLCSILLAVALMTGCATTDSATSAPVAPVSETHNQNAIWIATYVQKHFLQVVPEGTAVHLSLDRPATVKGLQETNFTLYPGESMLLPTQYDKLKLVLQSARRSGVTFYYVSEYRHFADGGYRLVRDSGVITVSWTQ